MQKNVYLSGLQTIQTVLAVSEPVPLINLPACFTIWSGGALTMHGGWTTYFSGAMIFLDMVISGHRINSGVNNPALILEMPKLILKG